MTEAKRPGHLHLEETGAAFRDAQKVLHSILQALNNLLLGLIGLSQTNPNKQTKINNNPKI